MPGLQGGLMDSLWRRLARSLRPHALVQVYVPSRDRAHRPISATRAKAKVLEIFLQISSGATTLAGEGVWRNGRSRPVREAISIVFAHLPKPIPRGGRRRSLRQLDDFVRWSRQDAVFVSVNGEPFLLKASWATPRPTNTPNADGGQLAAG